MVGWFTKSTRPLAMSAAIVIGGNLLAADPGCITPQANCPNPFGHYTTQWRTFPLCLEQISPNAVVVPFEPIIAPKKTISAPEQVIPLPKTITDPMPPKKVLPEPKLPEEKKPAPALENKVDSPVPFKKVIPAPDPTPMKVIEPKIVEPKIIEPLPESNKFSPPDPRFTPNSQKILPPDYVPDERPFTQNLLPATAIPSLPPIEDTTPIRTEEPPIENTTPVRTAVPPIEQSPALKPSWPMPPVPESYVPVQPTADEFKRSYEFRNVGEEASEPIRPTLPATPKAWIELPLPLPAPVIRGSSHPLFDPAKPAVSFGTIVPSTLK
ncbi:MAG: hypothetical protein K8T89_10415 [Planctomycetes bacterium]|nr:hypothetical protein [Planctomycetota bacterium]